MANSLPPMRNSRRDFLRAGIGATLATAADPAHSAGRIVGAAPAVPLTASDFKNDDF